jgi:hypothetical protein
MKIRDHIMESIGERMKRRELKSIFRGALCAVVKE